MTSTAQHKANYGYDDGEELTLKKIKHLVVPDDQHLIEVEYAKKIHDQKIYSTEYRIRLKDNSIRWIKSVGRILYNEKNEAEKLIGITLDVTELKLFTDELSKQVSERTLELQRSNEDLVQFAHVASHDLKEPIRKIKIFTGRLVNEFGASLPEKAIAYLEKVQRATTRMFAMIDGVLNYSMHGVMGESFTSVDLNKIIEQIQSDLELTIDQKKPVISVSKLPIVQANSILMYQLFYNLITNSLKFARPDDRLTITVTHSAIVRDNRNYLKIEFSDNGMGFENQYAEKIFEAFSRLNPKDEFEGTGLGLALCKKIVERHMGFISAKSEPGKGAVFTILLPT
jgi:light-regulated signal transduction histidine kinase (bacteriophytochrome)